MAVEVFTHAWAKAWCKQINLNEAYRKAAESWEGPIVLEMAADPAHGVPVARAVVADLWHGACRAGRAAKAEDVDEAPYVVHATPEVWGEVLAGRVDPIYGLMRGQLRLSKGALFSLLPYAVAAKELVVSARAVETCYPVGWD